MAIADRLTGWRRALGEFFFGLTGYEFAHHAVRLRAELETLFILITLGDLVGVPVLPSYYSLRMLPYVVPQIATWKQSILRPKEFWEREEYDLVEL